MYNTAARLDAIWWLADAVVPCRAINRAISVKDVTSTMMASPAGIPSRANAISCIRSGRSIRCQMRYGRYSAWVRSSQMARPSRV